MANEDFGMLSPEQVQKLANTISEAKNLTVQQEEIIKTVLAGETNIGKTRLAYLEQYFDTYSKNLDMVARKHSSLNDAFLILENKISDNSKKLTSDIDHLQGQMVDLSKSLSKAKEVFNGKVNDASSETSDKNTTVKADSAEIDGLTAKLIKAINDAGEEVVTYAKNSAAELLAVEKAYQEQRLEQLRLFGQSNEVVSRRGGSLSQREQRRAIRADDAAKQERVQAAYESGRRAAVQDVAAHEITARDFSIGGNDEIAATIETIVRKALNTRNVVDENQREGLNTVKFTELTDLLKDIAKINAWHPETAEARKDSVKSQKHTIARAESAYKETTIDLAIAKSLTAEQKALQETEVLLSKLQEAANAELTLQQQKNKTNAESAVKNKADAAKAKSITVNATEELKARQAIEAEVLAYRNQLELDYKRKHDDGKLTAAEIMAIDAAAEAELKTKLKKLDTYTKARLNSEKLTAIKSYDPKLAESLELEVAEKVDKKIRELKEASDGKVSQEQLEEARRNIYAEMDLREKHLDDLRKKNFSKETADRIRANNPKFFEELDKKRARRKAELELEYIHKNNGQLFAENIKEINERLDEEFDIASDKSRQLLEELGKQNIFETSLDQLKNGLNAATGKAIEERISRRRRELIDDARASNGGKLTEEDNERINEQLRAEIYVNDDSFAQYEDRITKLIFEQEKAEERLAKLKEVNAEKASEIELDMALLRAQKETEALRNNNGKLTQEALDAIDEKIARETIQRVNMYRVTAEQAAEVEADMASLRIQLEKEARDKYTDEQLQQELANIDTKVAYERSKRLDAIAAISDAERKENDQKRKKADPKALAILDEKNRQAAIKQIAGNKKISKLTPEELKKIKDYKATEEKLTEEMQERLEKIELNSLKKQLAEEEKARSRAGDQAVESAVSGPLTKENNLIERFKQLNELTKDETGEKVAGAGLIVAIKALSSLIAKLDSTIDKVGSYKSGIDTRLQGSKNKQRMGSYWDQLQVDMASVGAVTPFFKQEDFANNIQELVNKGIAHDLKQRAFLMTIQEKIANTFDVADGTLLRLIRLQQADSTAARLGMESALTEFLNNMYETTEYLSDVASSVKSSLEEMESLMGAKEATEVEYQVQKWMGSLYSVGMSSEAVQGIATAFGQLAAGQLDPLTGGTGAGNLLVMAANKIGEPIAKILTDGLDAKKTNQLLQATVDYLAEIANSSKDNNVVQQQLAGVFGVKASDLKAAVNLASDTNKVSKEYMTYDNMLKQLNDMAATMGNRTSVGEMMTNIWENVLFSLSSGVSSNPVSYFIYKMSSLLEATTGGLPLPGVSVLGNMVDLHTSVADLMRVGAMSGGIISMLPQLISGLGSSFSGKAMLKKLGIDEGNGLNVVQRGNGRSSSASAIDSTGNATLNLGGGSSTLSDSGYIGNSSGSDIINSTMQEAENKKKALMVEAKAAEEAHQIDSINVNVLKIYELLDEVASGKRSLRVRFSDYALSSGSGYQLGSTWNSGGTGTGTNGGTGSNSYGTSGDGYGTTGSAGSTGGYDTTSGTSGSGSDGGYGGGSSGGSGSGYGGVSLGGWTVI